MSDPMFVMSMYMNKTDLYEAKAKYYMEKSESLQVKVEELEDSVDRCSSRNVADADLIADLQAKAEVLEKIIAESIHADELRRTIIVQQATITELTDEVERLNWYIKGLKPYHNAGGE